MSGIHLDRGHNSNLKPVQVPKALISFGFEDDCGKLTGAEFLQTSEQQVTQFPCVSF